MRNADAVYVGKRAHHNMGCTPVGSGICCTTRCCVYSVQGNAVGNGSNPTPPNTCTRTHHGTHLGWDGVVSYCTGELGTDTNHCPASGNITELDGDPLSVLHFSWYRDLCICLKNPWGKRREIDMERRLPRTRCHLFTPIRF